MPRYKTLRPMKDPRAGYQTRRLLPGDVFELPDTKQGRLIGRVLHARKWSAPLRDLADVPAPPPAVAAQIAAAVAPPPAAAPSAPAAAVGAITTSQVPDERVALRAEYEKTLGKAPFPGWSSDVLREKIRAATESS